MKTMEESGNLNPVLSKSKFKLGGKIIKDWQKYWKHQKVSTHEFSYYLAEL